MPMDALATDLLIVAAHAPEMAGLRTFLSDQLIADIRGLHVRAKAVGIGAAAAGSATARAIIAVEPRGVLLIGSCGVYPNMDRYKPHDVVISSRIALVSHAVNAQRSEFPKPMRTVLESDELISTGLRNASPRAHVAAVACPLAQTIDDQVAASVQPTTGCEAENLEAFAVATACKAAEIPFAAVLGVSNIVGSTGSDDWKQFQRASVNAAADTIMTWVQGGAQGLPHG